LISNVKESFQTKAGSFSPPYLLSAVVLVVIKRKWTCNIIMSTVKKSHGPQKQWPMSCERDFFTLKGE
jgi:hypothetical protein